MKEEIEKLIADIETERAKAFEESSTAINENRISASTMFVGKCIAFDLTKERLIEILKISVKPDVSNDR